MITQSQQPLQLRRENPKPQDGKETKAADPPAENLSAPKAEQGGGLSKCRLTISTIIRFGHPTRRNEYEIPAIRNEQGLELKTLSACFLPTDQITLELSALSMQF